ncbi:MAG: VWA domain-containing protein [Phycisphaerales bacterium]|nr:MAG: VWA domain-containing protein [Phycisphaerales bacterium]
MTRLVRAVGCANNTTVNFLSPMTALGAAAIFVPLLLALYVLRLRRRYMRMASTLLWDQAVEDLEVNTPFQRLRWSSLLLVHLLLLSLLLLAMARPSTEGNQAGTTRVLLLIDQSASMNATTDAGRSRLEVAQETAVEMVDRLARGARGHEFMVIAFGGSPEVVVPLTSDRRALREGITSITPTHEKADIQAALRLAAAYAGDSEAPGAQEGEVILISDGQFAPPGDPAGFTLRAGRFRFHRIGPDPDDAVANVGITSFSARRDYEDPTRVYAFTRLINTQAAEVSAVITLRADGRTVDIEQVTIPGAEPANERGERTNPGELTLSFELDLPGGALLEISHNIDDVLGVDNRARLVMPEPNPPRIGLVYGAAEADPFLRRLLEDLDPQSIELVDAEAFAAMDESALDAGELFDLLVFDRVDAHRLPGVPSLTFGGVPRGVDADLPPDERGRRVLSWDRQHPLMRHVDLETVVYRDAATYRLPDGGESLAEGPEGTLIGTMRTRGARHVLVSFPLTLDRTNWSHQVSIVVFLQNLQDVLLAGRSGQMGILHQPGDAIQVRAAPNASELRVQFEGETTTLRAEPGQQRTLPTPRREGIIAVDGALRSHEQIAVTLLSDVESDLRPRRELIVNAESVVAEAGGGAAPRELWPWLILGALVLLMAEWILYCRKLAT